MPELSSFHDVLFPTAVSFGATGGPERRVEIVGLVSGREKRNLRTASSRRRYDAGTGVRSLDHLYEVLGFFEARRGPLHAFRFRDPFDAKSCRPDGTPSATDQALGTGDGAQSIVTHTPNLPAPALRKFHQIGAVFASKGYVVGEADPWHGQRIWMMERGT